MSDRDPLNLAGELIAEKYRVERLVGEGGFAVVYRAIHTIWNKPVAIKFFNGLSSAPAEQREGLMQDFINEGALLTELSSQTANIVQARDVGTYTSSAGQWMPYMVLEWLEGRPLDAILEQEQASHAQPWSLSEVYRVLEPAAMALDVAHGRGIAHRDIKPANLFVNGDPHAGSATVKVLDFGVAKMMSDNTHLQAALAKTGTNITSFTPSYGAPEQFSRAHGATGPWTDVYALALVAVEMLIGRPALDGGDLIQLAFSSANPQVRPTPRSYGLQVSDAVEAVFQKALHVVPAERYPSAGQFISALAIATGFTAPAAVSNPAPAPSFASGATVLASSVPTHITAGSPTTANPATFDPQQAKPGGKGLVFAGVGVFVVAAIGVGGLMATRGDPAPPAASAEVAAPSAAASAAPPFVCPDRSVKIPAGQFFMGSDAADAMDNEKPSHNVKLESFCMDLYEVTTAEYKACSDSGKCRRAPKDVEWEGITMQQRKVYSPLCNINDVEGRGDHPINCVTWKMADTFCAANGKRLPTEAEWEYATRGPDGRVYPWGDEDPTEKHLNACGTECVKWGLKNGEELTPLYDADDGFPTTAPVGKYPAGKSHFGPYDVVGNVWEWVADYQGPYTAAAQVDPHGPKTGDKRVIRGGAWNGSYKSWLRPSFRYASPPEMRSHGYGFRCAVDFPSAQDSATPAASATGAVAPAKE